MIAVKDYSAFIHLAGTDLVLPQTSQILNLGYPDAIILINHLLSEDQDGKCLQ